MHKTSFFLALAFFVCAACTGCVERRLIVRSNPPGALLKIDDEEIGVTPVSTSFVYYGTRKIQLVKDGYETLTLLQPIPAPWYEWPGIDLFSEHLVPGQRRDVRVLDYQLQPAAVVPTDQLLERGNQSRNQAHAGAQVVPAEIVPAPRGAPAPPPGTLAPGASVPNQSGAWPPLVQPLPAPQPAPLQPAPWPPQPAPMQPAPLQPGWQPAQ